MRKAIATVSLSGTLRDKLEAIAAAGFDAVELFEPDFITFRGDAREARAIAADLGLAIDLYQPFRDFEGMPDALFRRSLDRAERKFDVMQALGAPLVLVCSNTSPHALDDAALAADQLAVLADRAARRGLRIGFEALAWGRWVNRYRQAWSIVERAAQPNLGVILDSFHTLSLRDDPSGIRAIPGEKIAFLQMADAPLMAMDVLQWARHHRNFPGQGQFALDVFLEHVLAAGYTGTLSLEIFNDVFRATPNRRTATDAMRSLLFLEDQVRLRRQAARAHEAPAATDTRREPVTLFAAPPAPEDLEIRFIEFAVDSASETSLGGLLERLGFTCHGRHRTKAVTLYRQGAIHLVLNAEPASDARERFDEQGTSVCALGLATREAERAAARGTALLSARRDAPRGAHELVLPTIVAPGGTIVQFVGRDDHVEDDFVAATASASTADGPGLLDVDHIAMGLAPDQFDTWLLFSRAVLGLTPGEAIELADPFGLIRSSGVSNDARTLRIVLNVSLSHRTRSARQVSAAGRFGASVQHVALSCRDIFATVSALKARGVGFVPISANYYDDLVARLDLDPSLVERLRALDVLVDVDAGGRYLHAYSDTFDDRFFFEIVQREGYDAYGALNAPMRLASVEQRGPAG